MNNLVVLPTEEPMTAEEMLVSDMANIASSLEHIKRASYICAFALLTLLMVFTIQLFLEL